MSFFPYPTVSSFFEAEGDFEENKVPCSQCGGEMVPFFNGRTKETGESCVNCGHVVVVPSDDDSYEPCCYNSSRNFGTGEHEFDCPNR